LFKPSYDKLIISLSLPNVHWLFHGSKFIIVFSFVPMCLGQYLSFFFPSKVDFVVYGNWDQPTSIDSTLQMPSG